MQAQSDRIRLSIQSYMKLRDLKVHPWSKAAGVSPGALRNYLKCRSKTLTHDTLQKLADVQGDHLSVLIGDEPDPLLVDTSHFKGQLDALRSRPAIVTEGDVEILEQILSVLVKIDQRLEEHDKILRVLVEKSGNKNRI